MSAEPTLVAASRLPPWTEWLRRWRQEMLRSSVAAAGEPAAPGAATAWGAWRPAVGPSAAPTPARVLPELPHPGFKIQCLPLRGAEILQEQVRLECEAQGAAGMHLISSFTHDGHVFLVFRRS